MKVDEENRAREVEELQQVIHVRDKRLAQLVQSEISEEASMRMAVSADVSRIQEKFKDLKIAVADEVARIQGAVSSFETRHSNKIADLVDVVNAERATRERSSTAVKNDFASKYTE